MSEDKKSDYTEVHEEPRRMSEEDVKDYSVMFAQIMDSIRRNMGSNKVEGEQHEVEE